MRGIERKEFGRLADGTPIESVTLANGRGLAATILTYGGAVAALQTPDRAGRPVNIVLGFDSLDGYCRSKAFIGALVGRYANRIAGGRFVLDGAECRVSVNEPPNTTLHGGARGFDKAAWRIVSTAATPEPSLSLTHSSPDGDQGFPGQLDIGVRYTLLGDALQIDYAAATDRPTVVNLTNHSYFNLAGPSGGDILGHELLIDADRFTPVDRALIPTGEQRPVAGTPFDFRSPTAIGARIGAADEQLSIGRGYDHNFVLHGAAEGGLARAAWVRDAGTGRVMEAWTTEPGLQFYSGNFLDGSEAGFGGRRHDRHAGFCLETQHFPDSPNRPGFPSTVLRPGQTFSSTTLFRFSIDRPTNGERP